MDEKNSFRYFLEYAAARAGVAVLGRLPPRLGAAAGRALGRAAGKLLKSRSRLAEKNLSLAFPAAPPERIAGWVRECWENLGQSICEFSRQSRLTAGEFLPLVRAEGLEHLRRSLDEGRGAILTTGHFGNWEALTAWVAWSDIPLAVVGRRMKNPYVNDLVARMRARSGARVFMHRNAVREGIRWLKEGKVLGVLIDQRITAGGASVPFFGRPAHTTTMAALLSLRLGAPVHPLYCWREEGSLRMRVGPPIAAPEGLSAADAALRLTAEITADLERMVRERPPLWLWIHDRWKP